LALALAGLVFSAGAGAFSPPAWSLNQPIYEVNLEMFSAEGSFKGLEARLPELKALGVGILWLMPVTARGVEKAFGSPYCVRDYRGLHAPFGSPQDLKDLVAATHRLGMHLILDWVGNHSSWDNPLIKGHPEFYAKDKFGKISQAHEWADVAQFDYSNPALRRWMIEAMKYWVTAYDIDGFRCDVAWGIPVDFWVSARSELQKTKPLFMLAEADDPADQAAFDSDYDLALMNSAKINRMTDIAKGAKPASLLGQLQRLDDRRYAKGFMRMHFTTNHDEWKDNGTPFERLNGGERAFAVLCATLPGKPLIYNGQEIGWDRQKGSIAWSGLGRSAGFKDFYTRLFREFQRNPALYAGTWREIATDQPLAICSYERRSGTSRVLVTLNLSPRQQSFELKDISASGQYTDLFSGQAVSLTSGVQARFSPWEYQVLTGTSSAKPPLEADPAVTSPVEAHQVTAACGHLAPMAEPISGLAQGLSQGASAFFRAAWSQENLTVEVSVSKTPLVHDSPDESPWQDDSVEVYLDMKHDRGAPYQAHDFQYIVGYRNPRLFEAKGRSEGVRFESTEIPGGYRVRLELPWAILAVVPQAGAVYGFDVGVNLDQDGGDRDGALLWSGDDQNYRDTGLFGDIHLGPCALK
jgi:glycosidase